MIKIKFTDLSGYVRAEYYPVPSKELLPKWYKDLEPYYDKKDVMIAEGGFTTSTAKKCMPLFDAMSSGYIIKTHNDLSISRGPDGVPFFQWPDQEIIRFHSRFQAYTNPDVPLSEDVPKFINPWAISTPFGYSCWFKNIANSSESPFQIFEGIVDTDKYRAAVHFPFLLKDNNFSGIVPAGTPIAQVIPFKRNLFKMEIGGNKERLVATSDERKIRSKFFNVYKDIFWSKKIYQ